MDKLGEELSSSRNTICKHLKCAQVTDQLIVAATRDMARGMVRASAPEEREWKTGVKGYAGWFAPLALRLMKDSAPSMQ